MSTYMYSDVKLSW